MASDTGILILIWMAIPIIFWANWGTNSKFKASGKHPMRMYYSDFDNNGSTETVVCTYKDGNYYPLLGLDELSGQMVSLHKKFNAYKDFAGQSIERIFDKNSLREASLLEVHELRSGYLRNEGGRFTFVPFENTLQLAPITSFLVHDFDNNGDEEVLVAGNYFGVTPFHGRLDSFPGALIMNDEKVILANKLGLDFNGKSVRKLNIIEFNGATYLLVTINNDNSQVYQLIK